MLCNIQTTGVDQHQRIISSASPNTTPGTPFSWIFFFFLLCFSFLAHRYLLGPRARGQHGRHPGCAWAVATVNRARRGEREEGIWAFTASSGYWVGPEKGIITAAISPTSPFVSPFHSSIQSFSHSINQSSIHQSSPSDDTGPKPSWINSISLFPPPVLCADEPLGPATINATESQLQLRGKRTCCAALAHSSPPFSIFQPVSPCHQLF